MKISLSAELEVAQAYVIEAEHLLQGASRLPVEERLRREHYLEESRHLVDRLEQELADAQAPGVRGRRSGAAGAPG